MVSYDVWQYNTRRMVEWLPKTLKKQYLLFLVNDPCLLEGTISTCWIWHQFSVHCIVHCTVLCTVQQKVLNDLQGARLSRGRMIWLPTTPFPLLTFVSSTGDTEEDWERETICWRKGGEGGGREAESYDRKQARSSINYSILSGV